MMATYLQTKHGAVFTRNLKLCIDCDPAAFLYITIYLKMLVKIYLIQVYILVSFYSVLVTSTLSCHLKVLQICYGKCGSPSKYSHETAI